MNITNLTADDDNTILCKCTNNENDNDIEIIIPLITIVPCGISLVCLTSFMAYTLVKPLFNKRSNMDKKKII